DPHGRAAPRRRAPRSRERGGCSLTATGSSSTARSTGSRRRRSPPTTTRCFSGTCARTSTSSPSSSASRSGRGSPITTGPEVPADARSAGELVHRLAVYCQAFPCDRTRNVPGWVGWRLGLYRRPDNDEVVRQVRALIPAGAAHVVALCRLFLDAVGAA